MKKVLGMAVAMAAIFAFTANVGAQDVVGSNIADITEAGCIKCTKDTIGNVPTPATTPGTAGQNATGPTIDEICPFDYDDMDPASQFNGVDAATGNRWGYCPGTAVSTVEMGPEYDANGDPITQRNSRFILNVCECPEACNLDVGTKIGVQMTIVTPNVYWAEDPKAYGDVNGQTERTIRFNNYQWNPRTTACNAPDSDLDEKNFGIVKYYRSMGQQEVRDGQIVRTPLGEGTPLAGCSNQRVPVANQVQVIQSELATDYAVQRLDANECWFWIDIPAMRLDTNIESQKGDAVQVRVSLLWNRELDGICPGCEPAVICECIRTVAYIGCNEIGTDSGCLFFPYLTYGMDEWVTGVGISAVGMDSLPEGAALEMTLRDEDGKSITATIPVASSQLVWASGQLESLVADHFAQTPKNNSVVSLQVKANYRIDGFSFIMSPTLGVGAGQLPRTSSATVTCAD